MKKLFHILTFFAFVVFIFSSCSKEKITNPVIKLVKQAEGYAAGAATRVEIYTKESAITSGYMKFYIALYDSVSGKHIEDAHISLTPMMDMGTMMHSAPYENPVSSKAVNQLFPCSVTFIMSSMGGTWTLKIRVHNHVSDKEGILTIPVTVAEPAQSRMKSFTALHDGAKYFVSLIEPRAPKTGMNDLEIVIYKRASMMSFPADSSLSVTLTPEMPTMGHGSPNNVNPVHIGNGHFKGKVNFTMTGLWRLHLNFLHNGTVAYDDLYFDIEF